MPRTSVRRIRFQGLSAVELLSPALRLIVVSTRGPRIAYLGRPNGQNLLLWRPGHYRRGDWDLMGGHRFWLTRPGADEAEETYAPDNERCDVTIQSDACLVSAPPVPGQRVQRAMRVRWLARDRVAIEHRIKNVGDMLWSGGAWGLTCTLPTPSTTYVVPLSDGSAWDNASVTLFRRWGGSHTGRHDDPQFSFTADALLARSLGEENKRAIRAGPGVIAMHDLERDVLFVKGAEYCRGAAYPLESNLALYTGPQSFMVEMETMGRLVTLKPGEEHVHVEEWLLRSAGGQEAPDAAALGGFWRRRSRGD
jgi:hypothetical protein